jgi:hypothetical protein
MPETFYVRMSPQRRAEMNPCIRSQSNDSRRVLPDVGINALACPFTLLLPFGAIAAS